MTVVTRRTVISQGRYIVHTFNAPGWPHDSVLVVDMQTMRRQVYYVWVN